MALPPGLSPKTVTLGTASFADGTLATGRATISMPVNVVHGPSNRPIFSSDITLPFVDGAVSFNLLPTDAPGLNRVDWSYKLKVEIAGATVQPEVIYFLLPTNGPDTVDLDGLVTVPSSAGIPISVEALTANSLDPYTASFVANPASQTAVALKAGYVFSGADATDAEQQVQHRLRFFDTSAAKGSVVGIEHYGDGTNGNDEAWGLDIHNNPGAKAAVWIHQYSHAQNAVQIDNTDGATAFIIKNTFNTTRNPTGTPANTSAAGDFIRLVGYDGTRWVQIKSRGEFQLTPPADQAYPAMQISGSTAAQKLLQLTANGPEVAAEIVATSAAAGKYPLVVTGYDYGPNFTTTQNAGRPLTVQKNGTGAGETVRFTNKGTGTFLALANASTVVAQFNVDGQYEHLTAGAGILLRSPDGTRYKVSVGNGGTVSAVAA